MRVVTTRSRCAGDLRFVPSFEHHGTARNTFSFLLVPGSDLRTLAAMPSGPHRDEALPSNLKNSYSSSSLSLRGMGKGGLGATAVLSCHAVMSTPAMILAKPSLRVRTLLALLSSVLVLGSVW